MQLLHTLKSGKTNILELTDIKFETHHSRSKGVVTHLGWVVSGLVEEKHHRYGFRFTPEEAREHITKLQAMLSRFDDDSLGFITEEDHE